MSKKWIGCLGFLAIVILVLLIAGGSLMGTYNRLVTQNEQIDAS